MDKVHWPGLVARLRGKAIADLWYDLSAGLVTIELEGGESLQVVADWEGCQVVILPFNQASPHTLVTSQPGR